MDWPDGYHLPTCLLDQNADSATTCRSMALRGTSKVRCRQPTPISCDCHTTASRNTGALPVVWNCSSLAPHSGEAAKALDRFRRNLPNLSAGIPSLRIL